MADPIQDTALQISRANRGYRSAPQMDTFLTAKNFTMTYNGDGTINTITATVDILGAGTKTKTFVFGYTGANLTSITETIV